MKSIASSTLLVAACALLPQTAAAFGNYPNQLPNGNTFRCENCHVSPAGGGTRTPFGEDTRTNGPGVNWSLLYALDSDDDGQTNGEELGDPCGDWTTGPAPRTTDISHPGDSTDTSADPDTPACLPIEQDAGTPAEPAVTPEPAPTPEEDAGAVVEPEEDAGQGTPDVAEPEPEPSPTPEEPEPDAVCACTSASNNTTTSFAGLALFALGGLVAFRRRRR